MAAKKPAGTNALVQRAQVNLPVHVQEAMNADVAAFQSRLAAPTGNKIGVTQDKKFRCPPCNEFPAGGKFDTVRGIIVEFSAKKAWYEGAFDRDNIVPPNCFGVDLVTHDQMEASSNSPDIQSEDGCKACPRNQWVPKNPSDPKSPKHKLCKDSYVLVLLPPDADETTPLQTLELSATAVKPFDKYVRDLANEYGKPPYHFVTEFSFDPKFDYASVRCGNPEAAPAALVTLAWSKREEAAKLALVEPQTSDFEEKVVQARLPTIKKAAAGRAAARR